MALHSISESMLKKKLKKNKKPWLIAFGAAVLIIGGGSAAYFLLLQRHIFLGNTPAGAKFIPQDALLTASISTDAAQWQQLRQYGTPETQAALEAQLKQLQELLTANGYNYEQDVKPWLGKTVMIAYLPANTATPPAAPVVNQPDLIVLPIEKPAEAKQLLEKAQSKQKLATRTYKGLQIQETKKNNAQNYSVAILDSFLVVTKNPQTIERVIDTYKSTASMAVTPGYGENLAKISDSNAFAQLYLNSSVVWAAAAANSLRPIPPEKLAATQQRQGVAATVNLEPEGMRFRGISWLKPNSTQKYQVENKTNTLARRLPADTLVMFSGGNLSRFWQDNAQNADSNPLSIISTNNLSATLKSAFGLSFEEDLLPWMDGEFSVAMLPASPEALTQQGQSVQLGAGVVLMIQASDRARAEKTFQQLDQIMATRYQFQVEPTEVKGQPIVNWNSPLGGLNASHGWLDGNVVFLSLGAPVSSAFAPKPQAPLSDNQLFQQTVPTQPNPSNSKIFIDVDRAINNGTFNLSQLLSQEQRLLAKGMRSIGVTSAIKDQRSMRFDLFLQMKIIPQSPSPSPTLAPTQVSPNPTPAPTPKVSPSS
ncbi:MAG: DUF3352 domain-containing protein [Coleofasciculaceae cyanobacterium]